MSPPPASSFQHVFFPARDGEGLVGTFYAAGGKARGIVLVGSATAAPRDYYRPFAEMLTGQGLGVLTFDYRGVGDSLGRPLKQMDAGLTDWGRLDLPAAVDWIRANHPHLPILYVGHSVGGQLLGLVENNMAFDAILLVASQSGDYRLWPLSQRLGLRAWYNAIHLASQRMGYLPGWLLSLPMNLPRRVGVEWAQWGKKKGYYPEIHLAAKARFARLRCPILALSFDDDFYAPKKAVEMLLSWIGSTDKDHRHLKASHFPGKEVGHFGFFRQQFHGTLWPLAADFLSQASISPQD
jgi:predicted alpha/beta hydrolase